MDVKCLIVPGLLVAMVGFTVLSSISGRLSRQRERSRQAWLNDSMKDSKMVVPIAMWIEGQPIIEEHVPTPEPEYSTSNFVTNWRARKERQRTHAQKMTLKRAHERSAQEALRRAEVDKAIKQAYASLRKEM